MWRTSHMDHFYDASEALKLLKSLCVQNERRTGLWHPKGEKMMTEFSFLTNYKRRCAVCE